MWIKKFLFVLLLICLPSLSFANTIERCIQNLKEGNVVEATRLGKLAVVIHPDNPLSYMCLAGAYAKDKHYNFATVELYQALAISKSAKLKHAIDKMLLEINKYKKDTTLTQQLSKQSNQTKSGL